MERRALGSRRGVGVVRRLHLAVPPHEFLDGHLRVLREVINLRAGVFLVLTRRRRRAHLLLERRLVVLLVLALADGVLVLVLGGRSPRRDFVLDDVRERRVPVVPLRTFVERRVGLRPLPRRRLRLGGGFHFAVPRQQLLDGHLRVLREVINLRAAVFLVLARRRRRAHLLLERRLVVFLGHLRVVGDEVVLVRVVAAARRRGGKRRRGRFFLNARPRLLVALRASPLVRVGRVGRFGRFGRIGRVADRDAFLRHAGELRGEHRRVALRLPEEKVQVLVHHRLALGVHRALRLEAHHLLHLHPEPHHFVPDVARGFPLRDRLVARAFHDAALQVEVGFLHRVRGAARQFLPELAFAHEIAGEPPHLLQQVVPVCLVPRRLRELGLRLRARRALQHGPRAVHHGVLVADARALRQSALASHARDVGKRA